MSKEYKIKKETIEKIINEAKIKKIVSLVGENMSGKTALLRELRKEVNNYIQDKNVITIHIENPLNQFQIVTNNKSEPK